MKIYIGMELMRPTRKGNTRLFDRIICRKEEVDNIIGKYISDRVNSTCCIRVKTFYVAVRTQQEKLVKRFQYSPTYRD